MRDFLSGIFILVEDQFGVGDIVDLDEATGRRSRPCQLRTTRLRAVDGTLWHVPNGEIRRVGNKSQHWSRALLDVEVAYETDIEHARGGHRRGRRRRSGAEAGGVIEEPEVWGVEALGAHGVVLRLVVKTRPREQFRVSRELRERIKAAFDREGIEIPFPQQTVWHRQADDGAGRAGGRRGPRLTRDAASTGERPRQHAEPVGRARASGPRPSGSSASRGARPARRRR